MQTPHRASRVVAAFTFLLCVFCLDAAAQDRFELTGSVLDSSGAALQGATVVALQKPDSTMAAFGVTNGKGAFSLKRLDAGDYILQVTFVGYTTVYRDITLSANHDVGRLEMVESTTELDELTVSADHVPLLIKNDTVEYNTAAFKTRPNANVEELLRKLPGVEVEADGSIKAQGEDVDKVLVDGKEFFGDDPRIATKNLPAEAVDRVQVFDKQSDMAEFTGVDDGEEQKTINLALKEGHRNGYFGNVGGGYGPDNRYDGKVSVNRFSPNTQMSVLGNFNNVNRQDFSFTNYATVMGGTGAVEIDAGGFGSQPSGGISRTSSGGVNFNIDPGSRTKIRSSYYASHVNNDQTRSLLQQQLLGSNVTSFTNQDSERGSATLAHRLNLNVEHKVSTITDVRLRSNFNYALSDLTSVSVSQTTDGDGEPENDSQTGYSTDGRTLRGDARLTLRHRFGQSGRSLVSETNLALRDSDTEGDLESLNNFYEGGDVLTSEEVSQLQDQLSTSNTLRERVTYIEPFTKQTFLKVTSEYRRVTEMEDKAIYNRTGDMLVIDDELSSAFDRVYQYGRGSVSLTSKSGKLRYTVGADLQTSHLRGDLVDSEESIVNGFTNLLPQASASYEFAQSRNLELRYRTSTREPSIRDLQPFVDNADPLNIYVGNPDLKPELSHNLNLHYMLFDQFSFTSLFAFVNATYTNNKIISERTIDEMFRQTQTRRNRDGVWSVSGHLSFGTPVRPVGAKVRLRSVTTRGRGYEIVNGEENQSDQLRQSIDLRLENRKKAVVDFNIGSKYSFNVSRYSLNEDLNQNYVNRTYYSSLTLDLPGNWVVSSSVDYKIYSPKVFGEGQNVPLLQAELSKTFLRDRAELKLVGLDLLNKDVGFSYSSTGSFISEDRVNALGRYFLLKFVYNLGQVRNERAGIFEVRG